MNLLIEIDASDENRIDAFSIAEGDVIAITRSENLPGSHGLPPEIKLEILDGSASVESIGTYSHGVIVKHDNGNSPIARPTTPSSQTAFLRAKATGTARVKVVASFGDQDASVTFDLTVTDARVEVGV